MESADAYDGQTDFGRSYEACLEAVRARKADGGDGWEPKT